MKSVIYSHANKRQFKDLKPGDIFFGRFNDERHVLDTRVSGIITTQDAHYTDNGRVRYANLSDGTFRGAWSDDWCYVNVTSNKNAFSHGPMRQTTAKELPHNGDDIFKEREKDGLRFKSLVFFIDGDDEDIFISSSFYPRSTSLLTGKIIENPDPDIRISIYKDAVLELDIDEYWDSKQIELDEDELLEFLGEDKSSGAKQ